MPLFFTELMARFMSIDWSKVGSFMLKYWYAFVIAALLASNAWTGQKYQHTAALLKTEKAAHAADVKSYRDAQAVAELKAAQIKADLERKNREEANAADATYAALYDKYHANLVRFSTHQSISGQPSGGQQTDPAQGSDGPGGGAVVSPIQVLITYDDANLCAINTARLQAAHDWALKVTQ